MWSMRALKIALLMVLASPGSWAAETASFLDIGVGARALGMVGAYTALADDDGGDGCVLNGRGIKSSMISHR